MSTTPAPCVALNCDAIDDADLYSLDSATPTQPPSRTCVGLALNCDFPSDLDMYSLDGLDFFLNNRITFVLECPAGYFCPDGPVIWTTPPGTIPVHGPRINPVTQQIPLRIRCCNNQIVQAIVYVAVLPTLIVNGVTQRVNIVVSTIPGLFPGRVGGLLVPHYTGSNPPQWFFSITLADATTAIDTFIQGVVSTLMQQVARINARYCPPGPPHRYPPGDPHYPPPKRDPVLQKIQDHICAYGNTAVAVIAQGQGPFTFSLVDGSLPVGMNLSMLNSNAARISGVPTLPGDYNFSIAATETAGGQSVHKRAYVLHVLGITNGVPDSQGRIPLPSATVCSDYTVQLTAAGGVGPFTYTYDAIGNPNLDWLSISPSGLIEGFPEATEANLDFEFQIAVTDSEGNTCVDTVLIHVNAMVCTTLPNLPSGTMGLPYSYQMVANFGTGPYEFVNIGGTFPAGIILDLTGLVHGTPTEVGDFGATISVKDKSTGCSCVSDITLHINGVQNDPITQYCCPSNPALCVPVNVPAGKYFGPPGTDKDTLDTQALADAITQAAPLLATAGCACYVESITNLGVGSAAVTLPAEHSAVTYSCNQIFLFWTDAARTNGWNIAGVPFFNGMQFLAGTPVDLADFYRNNFGQPFAFHLWATLQGDATKRVIFSTYIHYSNPPDPP